MTFITPPPHFIIKNVRRAPANSMGQIVMDMAKMIGVGCQREGVERSASQGNQWRRGLGRSVRTHGWGLSSYPCNPVLTYAIYSLQVLPEMSTIIHQRDALEVENDRLRTILGLVD